MFPLLKVINLCTPTYELPPVMRILMPNPVGSGDHPGPLMSFVLFLASGRIVSHCYCEGSEAPPSQEALDFLETLSMENSLNDKGARVVATPQGVWQRDSDY